VIGFETPHDPHTILDWHYRTVKVVAAAPLGKQRRRDPKDDPQVACALAAEADIVVSRDAGLLVLEKPFGTEIITPRELLRRLAKPG
jgi:predicted nucleic acid-binding protein